MNILKSISRHGLPYRVVGSLLAGIAFSFAAAAHGPKQESDERRPYGIEFGADKPVCGAMVAKYNSDIRKFGIEQYSGSKEFDEFRWTPLVLRTPGPDVDAEQSVIDLYNDGRKQVVVRAVDTGMFNLTQRWYRVLKNQGVPSTAGLRDMETRELLEKSYSLAPERFTVEVRGDRIIIDDPEVAEPFIFRGTTYVSIRELPRVSLQHGPLDNPANIQVVMRYVKPTVAAFDQLAYARRRHPEQELRKLQDEFLSLQCVFAR